MAVRRSDVLQVLLVVGVACLAGGTAAGQGAKASAAAGAAQRKTAWGEPDLQGIWNNATVTPLERPKEFGTKEFLTVAEAGEYEKRVIAGRDQDKREGVGTRADVEKAYNQFWWDQGTKVVGTMRTSLIVDPPDGRVPAYTPEAQVRVTTARQERQKRLDGIVPIRTWTDLDSGERCITDGLPIVPYAYNNNYQIVQSPGVVAIQHEMFHDLRVIPLDGRPHAGPSIRQWFGDSRGRWEGNALVVETTNFSAEIEEANNSRGAGEQMRLTERFTRTGPSTLEYRFTIDDPKTFVKPWTAVVTMTTDQASIGSTSGQIFEYACHEGNYAMTAALGGKSSAEQKKGSR
jgi:hypothetical protein